MLNIKTKRGDKTAYKKDKDKFLDVDLELAIEDRMNGRPIGEIAKKMRNMGLKTKDGRKISSQLLGRALIGCGLRTYEKSKPKKNKDFVEVHKKKELRPNNESKLSVGSMLNTYESYRNLPVDQLKVIKLCIDKILNFKG